MHRALFARPSRITERGGTPFDSGINGMSRGVRSPGAWSVQPRSVFAPRDGYRQAIADSGEAPTYAGINNKSPFINDLFEKAVLKYARTSCPPNRTWEVQCAARKRCVVRHTPLRNGLSLIRPRYLL
jgi:hypothetical protein